MSKRIPITIKNESSLGIINHYSKLTKTPVASAISEAVELTIPIFEQCIRHQWLIKELKNNLLRFSIRENINRGRGSPEITLEEHCLLIWNTNIKNSLKVPVLDFFQLKVNDEFMGKDEKTVIHERLASLRESYNMEKAIYIYNQRRFDIKKQSISGDSNILLIHKSAYEEYYFDVGHVQLLPASKLIIFGINEVLRRREIVLPCPVICWIDIYHVNEMVLMLPVIRKTDACNCVNAPDDIIINPYSQESRK
ncbi:protein YagM [Citrobacter koseri]|uniref:protein YagM n=1 Tax=Citrobacter koseri TaxID=545 RepID=UPI004042B1EF